MYNNFHHIIRIFNNSFSQFSERVNSAKAANYVPNRSNPDVVYDTVENLIKMITE